MPMIFPYVDVLLVTTVKAAALFSATVKCDIIAKAVSVTSHCLEQDPSFPPFAERWSTFSDLTCSPSSGSDTTVTKAQTVQQAHLILPGEHMSHSLRFSL